MAEKQKPGDDAHQRVRLRVNFPHEWRHSVPPFCQCPDGQWKWRAEPEAGYVFTEYVSTRAVQHEGKDNIRADERFVAFMSRLKTDWEKRVAEL